MLVQPAMPPQPQAAGGTVHSHHRTPALACYALSQSALPLAQRLTAGLCADPWPLPGAARPPADGNGPAALSTVELFAPARFCPADGHPFEKIGLLLGQTYTRFAAHAFIGATGIAVRALAPLLAHKSIDAPVLVLDPAGQHVISLISGHWGGGNELARHVAQVLGATAVVTTASDCAPDCAADCARDGTPKRYSAHDPGMAEAGREPQAAAAPALDLLLRDAGLMPVDWDRLPAAQATLLEGKPLHLWDPCRAVPDHPGLLRLPSYADTDGQPSPPDIEGPMVAAHWRRLEPRPATLRVAVPRLVLGLGCRKDAPASLVQDAVRDLLTRHGLEPLALAALATVNEKLQEPALQCLAAALNLPLRGFRAAELARCATPNPSAAAGKRFGQPPFSVCEAAALLAADQIFTAGHARLLLPKNIEQGQLTLAVALADRISK
ncbi:cobalt-precorrin 5A hydrolase [Desulfovibrio desulfuricans]|uniref:cobalt-precorrin 5A hydrolase n=1 Tax=Desulfovibrio desulfuricans TaxID=876 RepID=UPI0035B34547